MAHIEQQNISRERQMHELLHTYSLAHELGVPCPWGDTIPLLSAFAQAMDMTLSEETLRGVSEELKPERRLYTLLTDPTFAPIFDDPSRDRINTKFPFFQYYFSYSLLGMVLMDERPMEKILEDLMDMKEQEEQTRQHVFMLRQNGMTEINPILEISTFIRDFSVEDAQFLIHTGKREFYDRFLFSATDGPMSLSFIRKYYQFISHIADDIHEYTPQERIQRGTEKLNAFMNTPMGKKWMNGPLRRPFFDLGSQRPDIVTNVIEYADDPVVQDLLDRLYRSAYNPRSNFEISNRLLEKIFLGEEDPREKLTDIAEILTVQPRWGGDFFSVLEHVLPYASQRLAMKTVFDRYPIFSQCFVANTTEAVYRKAYIQQIIAEENIIRVAEEFESAFTKQGEGAFSFYYFLGVRLASFINTKGAPFDSSRFETLLHSFLEDRKERNGALMHTITRQYSQLFDETQAGDVAKAYFDGAVVHNPNMIHNLEQEDVNLGVLGYIAGLVLFIDEANDPDMLHQVSLKNSTASPDIYHLLGPVQIHAGPVEHIADILVAGGVIGGRFARINGHLLEVYTSPIAEDLTPQTWKSFFDASPSSYHGRLGKRKEKGQVTLVYEGGNAPQNSNEIKTFPGITHKHLKAIILPHPETTGRDVGIGVLESCFVPIYAESGPLLFSINDWEDIRLEYQIDRVGVPHVTHFFPLSGQKGSTPGGRVLAVTRYGNKDVYRKELPLPIHRSEHMVSTINAYLEQTEFHWASVLTSRIYDPLGIPVAKSYVSIYEGEYHLLSEWVEPMASPSISSRNIASGAIADMFLGNLDIAYAPQKNTVYSWGILDDTGGYQFYSSDDATRLREQGRELFELPVRTDCNFSLWYLPNGQKKGEGNFINVPLPPEYRFDRQVQELAWGNGEKSTLAKGMVKYYVEQFGLTYEMLMQQAEALFSTMTDATISQLVHATRFSQPHREELCDILKARRDDIYTRVVVRREFAEYFELNMIP